MLNNEFKAGKYYIGDLCYYFTSEEWDEVCAITICEDGDVKEGAFELPDGRKFAIWRTAYGDGCYDSNGDRQFPVDSGTLGCVKVYDSIKVGEFMGGHVIETPNFNTSKTGGTISFGDLYIHTGYTDYNEE